MAPRRNSRRRGLRDNKILTPVNVFFIINSDPVDSKSHSTKSLSGEAYIVLLRGVGLRPPTYFIRDDDYAVHRDPKGPVLRDFLYHDYEFKRNSAISHTSN